MTPPVQAPTLEAPALELVAYRGAQQPGFEVKTVPAGYVLQGVSGATLDIAKAGDHSSLDVFVGKLTVGIEESGDGQSLGSYHGQAVQVDGHPGVIETDDGVTQLAFEQGHGSNNLVLVQQWSNIHLTHGQLLTFATGITVMSSAQRQHG